MMRITYTRSALRVLIRMPTNTANLIRAKIEQYAADPASLANNVTELKERPGFRLRVGSWRIIFDQDGAVLSILDIGPRGGVYG